MVERRRQLTVEGAKLSEELYPVIGTSAEGADRAALVGLRRAVFQLRMPADREWNTRVAERLPVDLADRIASWISRLTEHGQLATSLEETLASEIAGTQEALRDVAGHWSFQRALSHASPALFEETTKWLENPSRHLRRQSQVRLAKYVARAAAKTSPYSTFTISGAGTWSAEGPGVRVEQSACIKSVQEVTGFLIGGLTNSLSDDIRLAAKIPVRLNPSAIVHERSVRFLGGPPEEAIVSVPATPAVLECLRILDGGARCTMGELRDLLDDGEDPDDGRVEGFIAYLVDIGLLQRRLPVADLTGDPLGEMTAWLEANAGEDFADTVRLANHARSLLREPASVTDVKTHVVRQRLLNSALVELADDLGLGDSAERFDLFRDNAVFTDTAAQLSMPRWRQALEDLDVVRKVLAALDPCLPVRLGLAAYCAERFGPGTRVPLLVLHEAIAEDLASGKDERGHGLREIARLLQVKTIAPTDLPETGRLARLRELSEIHRELNEVVESSEIVDSVVRVRPDALASLAATWPEWVTAPRSVACYVQVADDEEAVRLVLNRVHGGFGRGRSRALHLIHTADGTVPLDGLGEITPSSVADKPAFAELCGLFGFSPNVRLSGTPYEIDYPFTESNRPIEQRIPLSALDVVHDPSLDQVHLAAKSVRSPMVAQHLGMMAEMLLPPVARLIARAFGISHFATEIMPLFTSFDAFSTPATVQTTPRIEIGRVVARRARWMAPTKQIPMRDKGESDLAYLTKMVTWLRANRIPTRCFVRVLTDDMFDSDEEAIGKWFSGKSHKPVYVDFANWYLTSIFERIIRGTVLTIFEEALPTLVDAIGSDSTDARVTEFIVEISEPETCQ
jgi:hypothetical protein